MDYEKKYNEALNWMRELYPGLHGATKEDAEHYFPELKESKESKDEKMRKSIIDVIQRAGFISSEYKYEAIAWLEKQKEQKPITINQDEKEFLADEIAAFLCNYDKEFDGEDPVPSEIAEHFYLLGKQAQEQKQTDEQFPPLEGLDAIKAKYYDDGFKNGFDEGVESVKPLEWSEEDEKMRKNIICLLEVHPSYRKEEDWLKALKDRGNFPKSNTNSPSEWSEEDKKMRINILNALTPHLVYSVGKGTYTGASTYRYDDEIRWLKSLSSQLHWKPSKDQMEALSETIAFAPDTFKPKCTLVTLQDDLKKL